MKFPWMFRCRRRLEWSGAAVLAWAGAAVACGPEFPNRYYTLSDAELLAAPEGFFAAEIARLTPPAAPTHRAVQLPGKNVRWHTVEIDIAEVKEALAERGVVAPERISWEYEELRRDLETWVEQIGARDADGKKPLPAPPRLKFAAEIPAEFRLYLTGAVAWHERRLDAARAAWRAVLELPATERKFRGVWAAFMLGRLEVEVLQKTERANAPAFTAAVAEARRRLRDARALVDAGFRDPLGLAVASLGWEARVALVAEEFPAAITLYYTQHVAGDATALPSLQRAARAALAAGGAGGGFEAIARDALSRRVITAFLVARGGPRFGDAGPEVAQLKSWALALEQSGLGPVPDADRLAWLAYEGGLFALAERWAALATDSPEAQWIRAKLALRGGGLRRGEQLLRAAVAGTGVGEAHRQQLHAEISRVCLSQDDFKGALAAAIAGGHWEDAAYVAERVMSLAELNEFVDVQPQVEPGSAQTREEGWNAEPPQSRLRHLLARRCARAGKVEAALRYFPAKWREVYRDYAAHVRAGFDSSKPAEDRARAFWLAARIARANGMELLGTELEPDWGIWGGDFELTASSAARRAAPEKPGELFAPTPVELARLDEHGVPEKRFHYRYRAAELGWWAASLLPNESEETANILTTAGGWLKARDPKAAQPFYQALVIRCGNTALGRAAAAKRWLPDPEPGKGG